MNFHLLGVFEGNPTVRVVYSDETGTGSEVEPFTIVVGVMFNLDSQWVPVNEQISSTLSALLPSKGQMELKGRLLYKKLRSGRTEPWATILTRLHEIAAKNRLQIFTGIVARKGMLHNIRKVMNTPKITDYSIAFGECLRAVDDYVATMIPREKILWIADKSREEPNLKDALDWQRITRRIDLAKAFPAMNLPQRGDMADPSRIVDTIYFGDSTESRALQLADVYCSTIALYLRNHALAKPYFQIIRTQIINFVGAV